MDDWENLMMKKKNDDDDDVMDEKEERVCGEDAQIMGFLTALSGWLDAYH